MSSPPQQNPITTSNAAPTTTTDYVIPLAPRPAPNPTPHLHPAIYQNLRNPTPPFPPPPPPPSQRQQRRPWGAVYPVASSGRGYTPKHPHDQNLVPNSAYPPYRPNGFSGQHSHQLYHNLMDSGSVMPTGGSVSANPKVTGQSSFADDKSLKNTRDKNEDDNFVIIRDRKVQISEGTSLYAQCRSWLKNGHTLENQPQHVDCLKTLPKPLPASNIEATTETDTEMEEKIEDVENMSAKELLQHHVRHAKKVRERLRIQRLQRIERYKDRLALLLPPVVDQQPKNDPTS